MTNVCGIDEAGRGPVIGPLVMCGAVIDEKQLYTLERIGVKDSKLLSPSQRTQLYYQIIGLVKYEIVILPPSKIDAAVLDKKTMNLNWLEANTSAEIMNKLKPDKAYVDCPSTNIEAYTRYLKERINDKKIELICEHKADSTYVICSAASILAKVTRDMEIEKLKKEIGIDFGSGYPSDPYTIAFLQKNWNKFDFFRKSWSSWQRYNMAKKQKKLGEF
ncbi:MAG: ribonuclease HII [Candidatus Woesearchaeota archaeon]|jgi:ribonuclease HII